MLCIFAKHLSRFALRCGCGGAVTLLLHLVKDDRLENACRGDVHPPGVVRVAEGVDVGRRQRVGDHRRRLAARRLGAAEDRMFDRHAAIVWFEIVEQLFDYGEIVGEVVLEPASLEFVKLRFLLPLGVGGGLGS